MYLIPNGISHTTGTIPHMVYHHYIPLPMVPGITHMVYMVDNQYPRGVLVLYYHRGEVLVLHHVMHVTVHTGYPGVPGCGTIMEWYQIGCTW